MSYHPAVEKIVNILKQNNFWYETFEHEEVRTSGEAARTRPGYTLHQGAKAMIVRVKKSDADKRFVMLVLPADLKFDNKKVKEILGVKDIRFATEEEIADVTNGVKVGAVPPFGNLFNLEVLADEKLFENDKIVFNAGDRCFSVAMKSVDYKNLVNPKVESFSI